MDIVKFANGILWGKLMTWLLLGTGIFYSIRLGLPQFRRFGHTFKVLFGSRKSETGGITSFQALCTGLAAQVGTGNIAGVATALASGGPGAVFWMWVTALLGMATIFGEAVLAQLFRVKNDDGTYRGGPAYYLEKGLGQRWMGILFAISIIVAMPFVFNAVQCNSIVAGIRGAFFPNTNGGNTELYLGIIVAAVTAAVIFGGLKRIAHVAEITVPFMAAIYIIIAIIVVVLNIHELPTIIADIFKSAFGAKQVAGGVLGHTVAKAFRYGMARGLFSNEAGMGSTPNAHATADVKHPARQGFIAMFGVFTDTIIICTVTASLILISGQLGSGKTGVELTQLSLKTTLGTWGPTFIAIALTFFAWTTILGNYYYGESNLMYLFPNAQKSSILLVYRIAVLGMIIFGAVSSVPFVWELADFFNGLMALLNLIGILLLSGIVVKVLKDYENQLKLHPNVEPVYRNPESK
ncbi:MAG: alanine/glycine:cation symporter family protein [Aminobacterium sp.]|jgi:AGCS family alanine or glycine:cation symporter|uniref:alanine/glycine:cation symporter family protein n=1 Tax=Aminobacterium sp. MB27-C1 TaxID=3070661 RepID=UPI001BCAF407|nr:alanine/glycine:cation symporter family protein [Aminobacterium sp. MB27-C1]MDD2207302.1 alanine/glycine:cation symporter family protein [Aminobacterium sp.]MDD3426643.1 alanine/glycine:cation symporter family protein [Aminobacterium sp.]MDD3707405.1 alanine/glycine:cation symporter family protein [Aminobacterium sp.]MDD4229045.1 alanine/glycine:cation symporter family protein [Aminobacterium sp.]MDD4552235.1 alanine/glycine:cation symporter family protein [Aminobacterium sp.]